MSISQYKKYLIPFCQALLIVVFWSLPKIGTGQTPFERIIRISQDSARVLLASTEDPNLQTLATYQIGRKFMALNIDSSIFYIDNAIRLAKSLDDKELINRMKKTLTFSLIDGQQLRRAEELLYEIKPFFKSFQDGKLYDSWCVNIGYLMTENGRFDEAIIYFTDALEIAIDEEQYREINDLYNRIGIVYGRLGVKGRSLEYYEKVIYNCEVLNERYMYSASLFNAAYILKEFGDKEKALLYFERVIEIRQDHKSPRFKFSVLNAKSNVAELQNDISGAIKYADSSLKLSERDNRKHDILSQYLRLQELYTIHKDQQMADRYLTKAYRLLDQVENKRSHSTVLSQYAELMSRRGEYETAYKIHTRLDSLEQAQKLGEAEDRVIKLEISEVKRLREIEMENLRNESDKIKLQLDKKENERLFLIILSLLLLGIIGLIFRNSQNRKRTNLELEDKNAIISKSLNEKNTLMKEIHHRVKNNLQIVSSMLSLQLRYIDDAAAKEVVIESRDRVKSMALIHQKLYQEDNLKAVFMPTYIESLLSSLAHSYKLDSLSIDMDYEVDELWIDVDTAMPIGMIVNELSTNAIKHAFDEKGGKIKISLTKSHDLLKLVISDNGIGVGDVFDIDKQECFGFKMVNSFVRKLKGELQVSNENGTQIEIIIKRFNEVKV